MISQISPGRPAKPARELRSRRVVTFATEQELHSLEKIAADEDRSLSALVHHLILKNLRERNQ